MIQGSRGWQWTAAPAAGVLVWPGSAAAEAPDIRRRLPTTGLNLGLGKNLSIWHLILTWKNMYVGLWEWELSGNEKQTAAAMRKGLENWEGSLDSALGSFSGSSLLGVSLCQTSNWAKGKNGTGREKGRSCSNSDECCWSAASSQWEHRSSHCGSGEIKGSSWQEAGIIQSAVFRDWPEGNGWAAWKQLSTAALSSRLWHQWRRWRMDSSSR